MAAVLVRAVDGYDSPTLREAVEEILTACEIEKQLKPETTVVLKVNLLTEAAPERAVTTHPAVVAAVIDALKQRGVRNIVIADSPSGDPSSARMRKLYRISGMADLVQDGVTLNENTTSGRVLLPFNMGMMELMEVFTKAPVLINLAKLKTHALAGLTLSVKNLFGAVPGLTKAKQHVLYTDADKFGEMLCGLAAVLKPAVSIVDGVLGMEGDGPMGGTPRAFGLLAGSTDPFCLDRALCHMVGFDERSAISVAASIRLGLAPASAADIAVTGDRTWVEQPLTDLLYPASINSKLIRMAPALASTLFSRILRWNEPRPVIQNNCIGCGRCAEICPKQIITVQDKRAKIHPHDCIRCFCCHEVCPAQAIAIKTRLGGGGK